MSARAAWRLESLGFTQVMRYTAGKEDWFGSGLPREGRLSSVPHANDLARRDVPTCSLTDRAGELYSRIQGQGWNMCVVVNDQRVVLGLVKFGTSAPDPQATAEEIMQSGPVTLRPSWPLGEIVSYMRDQDMDSVLVTTSDGELIGLLNRSDVEKRMEEVHRAHHGT
ncbi:MAG TPA: CBS domain-containing protein [Blastocatellia bacterium]|nr:CBS domain-containing protein [Blastocatellia bacterium]